MNYRRLSLVAILVLTVGALVYSCSDQTEQNTTPVEPKLSMQSGMTLAPGGVRLSGAIFTTTPDGGIVNENVHYESKLEVYLDGGPPPNAPQHAAGLPDGWYVFQVTDPSGWVLLSQDPAKCRVVEIKDDIIIRLVLPSEFGLSNDYTVGNGGGAVTYPCHVQDEPDGVAGPSGHHDTNTDVDYGENGAIVVQLMPFLDTPNPGGVYKAWVTPFEDYQAMGGDLDDVPSRLVKKKGVVQGFANDPGFGPPRNRVKTDNFKVKEVPPMIHVHKFEDLNGNGVWDAGEPEIEGWKIYITETLYDGSTVTNECYTPCWRAVAPGATVTVEEELPEGYVVSALIVDDVSQTPSVSFDVTFGTTGDHTVVFGNYMAIPKRGVKFHDKDADGIQDDGEEGLEGWEIVLTGTNGKGMPVNETTYTNAQGEYEFILAPGSYTVSEVCPVETNPWYQSLPTPTNGCGSGVYDFVAVSGEVHDGNDFGNYKAARFLVVKYLDQNLSGELDPGEPFLDDFTFCLQDANGELVSADDFVGGVADLPCKDSDANGEVEWKGLIPGKYTVVELQKAGWFATGATEITVIISSAGSAEYFFGNHPMNCVGLTPGYWKNWRNHYNTGQFKKLLEGTIAPTVQEADAIFAQYDASDPQDLTILKAFVLANQLTLNLSQHPELPNPSGGDLTEECTLRDYPSAPTLGEVLEDAIAIINGAPASDAEILQLKNYLDKYANQHWVVYP